MKITLTNQIETTGFTPTEYQKIIHNFTFANPAFGDALAFGRSTSGIDRQIKLYSEKLDSVESTLSALILPIGTLQYLLDTFQPEVIDSRNISRVSVLVTPFTGTLRPYQERFIQTAMQHTHGVMVAATGAGKTVSGIALAVRLQQRCLILVKSKDLAKQWQAAIKQFTGLDAGLIGGGKSTEGEQFTVGLTQTLCKRDLSQLDYGLVIADECFVGSTLIDGKPISQIKAGDRVNSFNEQTRQIEKRRVVRLYKNPAPTQLITILASTKQLTCTMNHPFYTKRGWIEAGHLTINDEILIYEKRPNLHGMQQTIFPNESAMGWIQGQAAKWTGLLFKTMRGYWKIKNAYKSCSFRKGSKTIFKKDVIKQPNEQLSYKAEGIGHTEENKPQAKDSRREWAWINQATNAAEQLFGDINRACNPNKAAIGRLPKSLQTRFGGCFSFIGNRNRWKFPLRNSEAGARRKERAVLVWHRLDSIEVLKQDRDERYSQLCKDGCVYNFEVEGNHTYIANGVVVHNCHNLPAKQAYGVINGINAKYKYGLSATPQRRDRLEFMIHGALGEIVSEIEAHELGDKVLPVSVTVQQLAFNTHVESWAEFQSALVIDEARNRAIIEVSTKVSAHAGTIILCTQVRHCELLGVMACERGVKALVLHGQLSTRERAERMAVAADSPLIIGTFALLSEGIDLPHLTYLIMAAPLSAEIARDNPAATRLRQSIGRCRRPYPGKSKAMILDICDKHPFGYAAFNKRLTIYKQQNFEVRK